MLERSRPEARVEVRVCNVDKSACSMAYFEDDSILPGCVICHVVLVVVVVKSKAGGQEGKDGNESRL